MYAMHVCIYIYDKNSARACRHYDSYEPTLVTNYPRRHGRRPTSLCSTKLEDLSSFASDLQRTVRQTPCFGPRFSLSVKPNMCIFQRLLSKKAISIWRWLQLQMCTFGSESLYVYVYTFNSIGVYQKSNFLIWAVDSLTITKIYSKRSRERKRQGEEKGRIR